MASGGCSFGCQSFFSLSSSSSFLLLLINLILQWSFQAAGGLEHPPAPTLDLPLATAEEKGAYFEISPAAWMPQNELLMTLYVHQVTVGSEQNQQVVVSMSNQGLGMIVANDWTVFDGMGGSANLVGNMQGIHTRCSMTDNSWCIYFDLVFKNGRFKGSALKLLGSVGPADGEWAIVGGTGELTLAQGVSSYKKVQDGNGMNIRELKFRVFYTPIES